MKVLIVDPDIVERRFLSFVFAAQGYNDLISVSCGREALERVIRDACGLIITEAGLPDMDGAGLCRALRSCAYHGAIMVVSEQSTVKDRIRAFEDGADDWINKPLDPAELMARVGAVLRRYVHEHRHQVGWSLRVGDIELSIRDMTLAIGGREPVALTPTETRLMECLMRNADVVVSREALVNRTWGFDIFGDSNRLDVYVRRLRHKIERDPSLPRYIVTVRSVGYVFRTGEQPFQPTVEAEVSRWIEPAQYESSSNESTAASSSNAGDRSISGYSDGVDVEVRTG